MQTSLGNDDNHATISVQQDEYPSHCVHGAALWLVLVAPAPPSMWCLWYRSHRDWGSYTWGGPGHSGRWGGGLSRLGLSQTALCQDHQTTFSNRTRIKTENLFSILNIFLLTEYSQPWSRIIAWGLIFHAFLMFHLTAQITAFKRTFQWLRPW